MIKLFVSDLDGTLLNENHVLSKENKDAVLELRKQGVSFMPASGRSYDDLQHAIHDLNIHPKCICLNGAEFYDNDATLLISNPLQENLARKIYQVLCKQECFVEYYTKNARYIESEKGSFLDFFKQRMSHLNLVDYHDAYELFVKEMDLENKITCEPNIEVILTQEMMKIEVVFMDVETKARVKSELETIKDIIVTSSHLMNLEINAKTANKGHMVEQVCRNYGYEMDEVVVIGDGLNDVTMLKRFPNSYAMGQASAEVKAAANFIAPNHENHGVADIIHQILENNKQQKNQ